MRDRRQDRRPRNRPPRTVGLKRSIVATARLAAVGLALLPVSLAARAADTDLVPVRMAVNLSGGQGEVPYVVQKFGLDKKHGLSLEEVALSAPGQQYIMFRS